MSSILASLDMSLDDIISKKKTNPDARPAKSGGRGGRDGANASSSGPVRGNRRTRGRRNDTPYSRGGADGDDLMDVEDDDAPASKRNPAAKRKAVVIKTQQSGRGGKKGGVSILARLGKADAGSPGTKILVKNLKYDILEDDVRELFLTVGKVSKAEIVYDRSGRSKGIARVWFAKHSDAEKAIKQYDGRTLDGQAMSIILDTDKNVRNGVFGTALGNEDVKFKVNLGDKRDSRDSRDSRNPRDSRDSRDSRGRGGRGGRRDGGGRGGRSNGGGSKSTEDLDNEMDSYMKDA